MRAVASGGAVRSVAVLGSEVGSGVPTVLVTVAHVVRDFGLDDVAASLADDVGSEASGLGYLLADESGVAAVLGVGVLGGHARPSSMAHAQRAKRTKTVRPVGMRSSIIAVPGRC